MDINEMPQRDIPTAQGPLLVAFFDEAANAAASEDHHTSGPLPAYAHMLVRAVGEQLVAAFERIRAVTQYLDSFPLKARDYNRVMNVFLQISISKPAETIAAP
jgi:hypothetical protein